MSSRLQAPGSGSKSLLGACATVLAAAWLAAAVVSPAAAATVTGTAGADVLRGTNRADVLKGMSGNDTLDGRGGNDRLLGGPGRDRITCGKGRDVVYADRLDRVARDCEVVLAAAPAPAPLPKVVPVPAPLEPPLPPVTPIEPPLPPPVDPGPQSPQPPQPPPPPPPPPPTPPAPSPCGQGPQSFRYSVITQPIATPSVTATIRINKLPSYPVSGDHALAYVGVQYGISANGCYATGWLQGGIWRGATPNDPDSGRAFLYAEWQTATSYRLIRLSDVTIPSSHTFTLSGSGGRWALSIDGVFVTEAQFDGPPSSWGTAAEVYRADGGVDPSFDWTFWNASPAYLSPPRGLLPYEDFTGTGWRSRL